MPTPPDRPRDRNRTDRPRDRNRDDRPSSRDDLPRLVYRPLGYVEDWAVVRRIGDRDLYVGNYLAAHPDEHDHEFDYVLSVSSDSYPLTTHHHPLEDGPGNDWPTFAAAVDAARDLYRREGSLLVHCKAGVSRSATVLAAAMAAEEGTDFRDALDAVHEARPLAMPNPPLHEQAVIYLTARA